MISTAIPTCEFEAWSCAYLYVLSGDSADWVRRLLEASGIFRCSSHYELDHCDVIRSFSSCVFYETGIAIPKVKVIAALIDLDRFGMLTSNHSISL